MTLQICEKRQSIIRQDGHLLVLGGPGSGKTTVALLKAKNRCPALKPGQEILFLSFSRAAVRQVLARCKDILSKRERSAIRVQTYHAFCMDMLRAHGRLLRGRPVRFLYPGDERLRKSAFDGDWNAERRRFRDGEGEYCFDFFAGGTADLLEGCAAVRSLVGNCFPLIIVDEFQDTDDDQWRLVRSLASSADVFCLADPDQQIYDWRNDIDPRRLDILRENLTLSEYNLEGENHRSPNGAILAYADAVLRNRGPLPKTQDVKTGTYYLSNYRETVHAAVGWTFSALRDRGVTEPSVAVLTRSNSAVAEISAILSEAHTYKKRELRPIQHAIVWDAELSAAAAFVVGSMLEWSLDQAAHTVPQTLDAVARFYSIKNAEHPSKVAATKARKYQDAAESVRRGKSARPQGAKALLEEHPRLATPTGDPVKDWKCGLSILNEIGDLEDLYREARLVRLFKATDAMASGLRERWLASDGMYSGAADLVKRILEQERLIGMERDHQSGCALMSIHKSKGKEFDGVVLVEGAYGSKFFQPKEPRPCERRRRLLRVGITRARALVTLVRPRGAVPLVGE